MSTFVLHLFCKFFYKFCYFLNLLLCPNFFITFWKGVYPADLMKQIFVSSLPSLGHLIVYVSATCLETNDSLKI